MRIGRRLSVYFIAAAVVAVVVTAVFEIYSLGRTADDAVDQHVRVARTAARYVEGVIEHEGHELEELLATLPVELDNAHATAEALHRTQRELLDDAPLAVFDGDHRVIASQMGRAGLPPARLLYPAMRQAVAHRRAVVTDFWRGPDRAPRVAVVVARKSGAAVRTAVAEWNLDGKDFQRLFRYFVINERSRLQLLDSRGTALFTTFAPERYQSLVHGTYFSDRVREGTPTALRCHSCHRNNESEQVREQEIMALAPIIGSSWSVTVRESEDDLFAPVRQVGFTSVALVSLVMGVFIGAFILIARRVLTPIRQLARVATEVAGGQEMASLEVDLWQTDEFAALARSLRAIEDGRHVLPPSERPPAQQRNDLREAVERALDTVLVGLTRTESITAAALLVEGGSRMPSFACTKGMVVPGGAAVDQLCTLGTACSPVSPADMLQAGIEIDAEPRTHEYFVQQLRILETLHGQLWIGVDAEASRLGKYFRPVLGLMATLVQSLVARSVLNQQLRREHQQKGRMLQHLFEAEDEERRRIARDIHDDTAQLASALLLQLETIPSSNSRAFTADRLEKAKELVRQILDQTDRLIRRLRPALLDELGLIEAVQSTGKNLLLDAGIDLDFEAEGSDVELPKPLEIAAYRVLQEAMTNIVRHADATTACVRLNIAKGTLRGCIEDNGKGMDLSWLEDPDARPRWGLAGMRERIVQLGGRIDFFNPPEGGVRIAFEVPFAATEQED